MLYEVYCTTRKEHFINNKIDIIVKKIALYSKRQKIFRRPITKKPVEPEQAWYAQCLFPEADDDDDNEDDYDFQLLNSKSSSSFQIFKSQNIR